MNLPTIIINAYNRPKSIKRLLLSLDIAEIHQGTNLVFSLEYNPHPTVLSQVVNYHWSYGKKELIQHKKKLGLVGHFLFCGGLTEKLGTIIYLEDDLFVGRNFYKYTLQVLKQYANEEVLAGFSLNALWFNGYLHTPFKPIDDGNTCFFLQVPWYQGQVYTPKQWHHFINWYKQKSAINNNLLIHEMFRDFKLKDEWFPIKTQYLVENNKYYCFPRVAHCVNFGDSGTHFKKTTNFFQTELSIGKAISSPIPFKEVLAIYDSFYELIPEKAHVLTPHLQTVNFELDLNGTKDLSRLKSEYVITSVKPTNFERSYGLEMRPHELNIIYQIVGNHFYLAKTNQQISDRNSFERLKAKFNYYYRFKISKMQQLKLFLSSFFKFW